MRQVVTLTQGKLVGVDVSTGALLWERGFVSANFTNSATPILYGQTLIVSNGGPAAAFTVIRRNNEWVVENAWENADVPFRLSNGVIVGDMLFGLSTRVLPLPRIQRRLGRWKGPCDEENWK